MPLIQSPLNIFATIKPIVNIYLKSELVTKKQVVVDN